MIIQLLAKLLKIRRKPIFLNEAVLIPSETIISYNTTADRITSTS